jgi:hypothetical protein
LTRQVSQHGHAGFFGLSERFKGRASDLDGALVLIYRTPRRHEAGAPVKAWTAAAFITDHKRKTVAALAPENPSRINARLPRLGLPVLKRQQRDRFDSALTCWTPGWSRSTGSTIRSAGAPLNFGNGNALRRASILRIGRQLGIGTSVVQRVFRETPWKRQSA